MNLENQSILLVTKHNKQEVIAPAFKKEFNAKVIVCKNVDTDKFGMFSGEIKRIQSAKETVLNKALEGLKQNPNFEFAIASEGSFGNHPDSVFLPYNEEWLVIVEKSTNEAVYAKSGTVETNFANQITSNENEIESFLNRVPNAKYVLKTALNEKVICKGISEQSEILKKCKSYFEQGKQVLIETDLRAMNNPLRMQNIEAAAHKLIDNLKSKCPSCNKPGFTVKDSIPGLLCELCEFPSNYPKNHIKICDHCSFEQVVPPVHGLARLDAQYCNFCNP